MSVQETIQRRGYAMVDVELLRPNPLNPRSKYDEVALQELTDSIRVFGVLEPLLVTPIDDGLVVVAGERRRRAALAAGVQRVPVVIEERSATEQLEVQLTENLLREDLGPVDEARAIQRLLAECGMTQEQLGARLGKSQPWISNRIRLLRLPETVIAAMAEGKLTPGHAQALLKYEKAPELVERAAKRIVESDVPVSKIDRDAVSIEATRGPSSERNDYRVLGYGDQEFVARGCSKCPHYHLAGYQKLCLDPECFDRRQAEAKEAKLKETDGLSVQGLREAGTPFADEYRLKQVRDAECEGCNKRKKARPSYGSDPVEICLDPKCCARKAAAADKGHREAALAAMNAELDQIRAIADEAAAGLEPRHLVLLLMELLRADSGQSRHYEAGKEWPGRKQLLGSYFSKSWPGEEHWNNVDLGTPDRADKMRSLAENLLTRKPAKLRSALVEWALLSGIDKLGPVLELVGFGGQAEQKATATEDPPQEAADEQPKKPLFPPALTRREPPWPTECPAWEVCRHWGGPEKGCTAPAIIPHCSFALPDNTDNAPPDEDDDPDTCPNRECPHWDENGCTAPADYACPLDETELQAAAEENGEPEPDEDDPEPDTLTDLIQADPVE